MGGLKREGSIIESVFEYYACETEMDTRDAR